MLISSGGVAYHLLRMHPDRYLPSMLVPDPGPAESAVRIN
jgi:hypothetical protein